jgi:4-hydroxy-3-methylbut-2-enyl diphosphate reductase IspH
MTNEPMPITITREPLFTVNELVHNPKEVLKRLNEKFVDFHVDWDEQVEIELKILHDYVELSEKIDRDAVKEYIRDVLLAVFRIQGEKGKS